jgi:restriction endonuclease S subunit
VGNNRLEKLSKKYPRIPEQLVIFLLKDNLDELKEHKKILINKLEMVKRQVLAELVCTSVELSENTLYAKLEKEQERLEQSLSCCIDCMEGKDLSIN